MVKVKIIPKSERITKLIEEHGNEYYMLDDVNRVGLLTPIDDNDKWIGFINRREADFETISEQ